MRAVLVEKHGPPEALRIAELPDPEPGPGEVRVRVRTAGIAPFDTYARQGRPDFSFSLPHQLGNEFAGVVDRVGPDVRGWVEGDEVLGWATMASLAEYVVAAADAITRKPETMPWEVAGGLTSSGQPALTALRELGVAAGETLLVHAAAGAVGTVAVQVAVHRGVRVVGTAREDNHPYLRKLGATPVTYGPGLVPRVRAAAQGPVDAALDAIGGQALRDSLALVPDRNRIATLVDHAVADEFGVRGVRAVKSVRQMEELVGLHTGGLLRITVRATFPLEAIVDAHREIERGHGRGKVVVTVD